MLRARLARWTGGARLAGKARRTCGSGRLCINVLNAAVLLIHCCHCSYRIGFTGSHHLRLGRTGLARRLGWTCLIRVAWRARLTRLTLAHRSRLSTLTRRTLLALRLGKRGIHVAVHVPRFVIVVTAIAVASVAIVHVIHL